MFAELLSARIGKLSHIVLAAKVQAARRARFDASWLQTFTHAVAAQRAFVNALRFFIEFGNVEWASGNAIAAADTIILLKIHDTVRVLDDRTVRGASGKTSRISAMHAL